MNKYVLVRETNGDNQFLRELRSDEAYTDDIGCAMEFNTEAEAIKEQIDDEQVAKIIYDENGAIDGYEIVEWRL